MAKQKATTTEEKKETSKPAAKTTAKPAAQPAAKPAAKAPATKTPAKKPAAKAPAAKKPATKAPAAKAPEAKTPAAKTPEAKAPEAKTPVSKAPAAKKPASRTNRKKLTPEPSIGFSLELSANRDATRMISGVARKAALDLRGRAATSLKMDPKSSPRELVNQDKTRKRVALSVHKSVSMLMREILKYQQYTPSSLALMEDGRIGFPEQEMDIKDAVRSKFVSTCSPLLPFITDEEGGFAVFGGYDGSIKARFDEELAPPYYISVDWVFEENKENPGDSLVTMIVNIYTIESKKKGMDMNVKTVFSLSGEHFSFTTSLLFSK